VIEEIKKFLENDENTTYQNLWNSKDYAKEKL
jgi:hypothetical protein